MNLVAKATGYGTYYANEYMRKCVDLPPGEHGPKECGPCAATLAEAFDDPTKKSMTGGPLLGQITVANEVYKSGYLPPAEVAQLKDLIRRMEACP